MSDENQKGLGLPSADPVPTKDVRLLSLALQERWPISPEARAALIARLERVVQDPNTKPRAFAVASKALLSLSRVNLSVVDVAGRAKQGDELAERVAELERRVEAEKGTRP